tara:strand:- start:1341 stop:1880 length:540 start_codon:yes stop_codon:yes gene_type:complete
MTHKKIFHPFKSLFSVFTLTSLLFLACTPTTEQEAQLKTEATAMGPFFAGPNSLIAEIDNNTNSSWVDGEIATEKIKEASLKSIRIDLEGNDSLDLSMFASVALSIVSQDEPMTNIAVKNPIEGNGTQIVLDISDEADIAPFLKTGKFTLVLDWDLLDDDFREEMSSSVLMNLNLKITD